MTTTESFPLGHVNLACDVEVVGPPLRRPQRLRH
jgi:hypothetical protein